jgi:hypothetical protein
MQRSLSILLLLLIGFPLIGPLLVSDADVNLPMCCRRNGAHHCSGDMAMSMGTDAGPTVSTVVMKCPAYPKAATATLLQPAFFAQTQTCFAAIIAHPNAQPQTEARYRIAFSRSRQKRGPPVILV